MEKVKTAFDARKNRCRPVALMHVEIDDGGALDAAFGTKS